VFGEFRAGEFRAVDFCSACGDHASSQLISTQCRRMNMTRWFVLVGLMVFGSGNAFLASRMLGDRTAFALFGLQSGMFAALFFGSAFFIWRRQSIRAAKCLAAIPAFLLWS